MAPPLSLGVQAKTGQPSAGEGCGVAVVVARGAVVGEREEHDQERTPPATIEAARLSSSFSSPPSFRSLIRLSNDDRF